MRGGSRDRGLSEAIHAEKKAEVQLSSCSLQLALRLPHNIS